MKRILLLALLSTAFLDAQTPAFDTIVRHGTVIDGSGNSRFNADVGIRNGFIAAIGDLRDATAVTQINATGLFVTPGFINIHSHASADALPTAVNMLTQGVTTEIFNADGSGPLDIAQQMQRLGAGGLAVNIGGYIGFNSIWREVIGETDRRPTPEQIQRMRSLIVAGLDQGAWGISAGLEYKPGNFARTEEVIQVVEAARLARTNFTNHDRVTPESNYSSQVGAGETLAIGEKSGLVPVVTHMKAQGSDQGKASVLLASMAQASKRGHYTAADAYPYLAGQTGVGSFTIPAWAQDGDRAAVLKRFADPAQRARIIKETEATLAARFGGPQSIYLRTTRQELTAVMKEMNVGAGEAILRILEQGPDPGAIIRFGVEEDLVKILKDPVTAMACDCGASTSKNVHPRFYGSFPRVLGHYVREQKAMTWEEAIRKSTSLPASTIGMVDRGRIAAGMVADLTVFDPDAIIDRATYENPTLPSEGIRFVLVNGVMALENGASTGLRGGRALHRTSNMPSRPSRDSMKTLRASGSVSGRRVAVDVTQRAGARQASGIVRIDGLPAITSLGVLQATDGWTSFSATAGVKAVTMIVDLRDPRNPGSATIAVDVDGVPWMRGTLPSTSIVIRQ
jgi:N-acyl-D-amino-acid deacylase